MMFFGRRRGKQDESAKPSEPQRDSGLNPEAIAYLDEHFERKTTGTDWEAERVRDGLKLREERAEVQAELEAQTGWRIAHHKLDSLIGRIIRNNDDGLLNPLLRCALQKWAVSENGRGYLDWSHSVCHQFEKCSEIKGSKESVLDFPELREEVTALVNEAGRRAVEAGDAACFPRLLQGIVFFNLRETVPQAIDEPMLYKPEILSDRELGRLLFEEPVLAAFCRAQTMREFIDQVIVIAGEREINFRCSWLPLELLEAAETSDNRGVMAEYFARTYASSRCSHIEASKVLDNVRAAREAKESCPGVFVDVEGTLLSWGSEGPTLTGTAKALMALCPAEKTMTIITGGDVEELSAALRSAGLPERFLPVRSKKDFYGKRLEVLIDDTAPEIQGLSAGKWVRPSSWYAGPIVEADPFGTVELYKASKGKRAIDLTSEDL